MGDGASERSGGRAGAAAPRTVGVVGLGLVGGSLARRLKEGNEPPEIVASSLDRADLERAVDEGVVDRAAPDAVGVAASADLVVYATPIDVTLDLLTDHRDAWSEDAVVTDVASLKAPVERRIRELGAVARWVGSHPMAGSEESGYGASRSDLFDGAPVYLVREGAPESAARLVEAVWARVGARPRWTGSEAHDRRMIWASHLPQMVSNALAAALARRGVEPGDLGPGGRDMTRLAGSAPDLWRGLLEAAGEREVEALTAVIDEAARLRDLLQRGEVSRVVESMEATRRWKEGEGWS